MERVCLAGESVRPLSQYVRIHPRDDLSRNTDGGPQIENGGFTEAICLSLFFFFFFQAFSLLLLLSLAEPCRAQTGFVAGHMDNTVYIRHACCFYQPKVVASSRVASGIWAQSG